MSTWCALLLLGFAFTAGSCSSDGSGAGDTGAAADGSQDDPDIAIGGSSDGQISDSQAGDTQGNDTPDVAFVLDVDAPDGLYCNPGSAACTDFTVLGVCNEAGSAFVSTPCPAGQGCDDAACVDPICTPGEHGASCPSFNQQEICNPGGTEFTVVDCLPGYSCIEGACIQAICLAGNTICKTPSAYAVCLDDASGYGAAIPCDDGELCDSKIGACIDACDANSKANNYVGCNYFAVDLDNVEGGQAAPVAIVVSLSASESKPAKITIEDTSTGQELTAATLNASDETLTPDPTMMVAPGHLKVFFLPVSSADQGSPLDGSVKKFAAFRIGSDAPVTVHQFNPLNGEGVFTNDASLLLPSNLGGKEYIVMGWPHRVLADEAATTLRGFVTVVATEPGTTTVEVFARGRIAGGVGVPAIQPNQSHSFSLMEGEVLNLETDGDTGADLTGTFVRATQKVSVFSGHECANVPVSVSYCDHIEQQLIPVQTWGSTYIADAFSARNSHQFDLWRVVGGGDNITVSTDPPIPGFENFVLHKGSFVELQAQGSFEVKADGPILLGHYMVGSNYPGFAPVCTGGSVPSGIGDPALTLGVPTQQFLSDYQVLTPPGYAENFLNIVALTDTQVMLDGTTVSAAFTPVGNSGYGVAQVPVTTGVHTVTAVGGPIGVTAYGYDCDVSYAYPGGLKLEDIKR